MYQEFIVKFRLLHLALRKGWADFFRGMKILGITFCKNFWTPKNLQPHFFYQFGINYLAQLLWNGFCIKPLNFVYPCFSRHFDLIWSSNVKTSYSVDRVFVIILIREFNSFKRRRELASRLRPDTALLGTDFRMRLRAIYSILRCEI